MRKYGAGFKDELVEIIQESLVILDLEGRVTYWNAASERLYGWGRKEVLGRVAAEVFRDPAGIADLSDESIPGAGPATHDRMRLTADGRFVTVRTSRHLRRGEAGEPDYVVETGIDVTEQYALGAGRSLAAAGSEAVNRVKIDLEYSEQRYRRLFHFVPVALIRFDRRELKDEFGRLKARGVKNLAKHIEDNPEFMRLALRSIKIMEVNSKAVELFEANGADEMIGSVERLWSESPEVFARSMQARFTGALEYRAEIRIKTFSGKVLNVLYVTNFPEAFEDTALGLACLIDITERIRTQEVLAKLQSEYAHAARISMLGELAASITHEVNQPLGAILISARAALNWIDRPDPDMAEVRALSVSTIEDAKRAASIIDHMRDMASYKALERTRISINAVVNEAMMFLGPELSRHGVEAVLELSEAVPEILGDRVQLQQILANLTINAIQAMDASSRRRVTLRTIHVPDEGLTHIEVEDTGPGIPQDCLDQLFQSFFTTKPSGMGIGLSVCRSIIEAHGGTIRAWNQDGGGACFRFSLPL